MTKRQQYIHIHVIPTGKFTENSPQDIQGKNLLTDRVTRDTSPKHATKAVELGDIFCLSPLALEICKFIKEFDPESAIEKKKE